VPPSLLEGQLASAIYAGFKGKLLTGRLWRARSADSGGLDGRGDPISPAPISWTCQGFTDLYRDAFRPEGVEIGDVKVCIFAKSLPEGVRPRKDDKALFGGSWYQLRGAETDPATALWVCPAFATSEPD
jgi:hypothetical protein